MFFSKKNKEKKQINVGKIACKIYHTYENIENPFECEIIGDKPNRFDIATSSPSQKLLKVLERDKFLSFFKHHEKNGTVIRKEKIDYITYTEEDYFINE